MARTLLWCSLALVSCRLDMHDQPRYEAYEASALWDDGTSARPPPPGTVARGELEPEWLYPTGRRDGVPLTEPPMPVSAELLLRGKERFEIYCSPCHDSTGSGQGVIVARGFKAPPTFHSDRLRAAPIGHFVEVIANGFGAMFPYGSRVAVRDRWAIAAYIRVLQRSQHVPADALSPEDRARLEEGSR